MKLELLDERVVVQSAAPVLGSEPVWVLIDAPEFVGLAAANASGLTFPSAWSDAFFPLVEDVRIFGPKGEWHAWKLGPGLWGHRVWLAQKDPVARLSYIEEEFHWLWGRELRPTKEVGWFEAFEIGRGISFRLPAVALVPAADPSSPELGSWFSIEKELPLKIRVRHLVEQQTQTGLAAVVDAALRGVFSAGGRELVPNVGISVADPRPV